MMSQVQTNAVASSSTFGIAIMFFIIGIVWLALFALMITITVLIIKALLKYLKSSDIHKADAIVKKSLSEVLKSHRISCNMTQEFVAESMGVSRQAVSKWENGTSDPSTSNLLKLAKLYGVSAEELLKEME